MSKMDMLRLPWAILVLIFDGLRSSKGRLLLFCVFFGGLFAIAEHVSDIFRKMQK